jgi:2'-5' RNA ligase/endonuclease/exonuclease/phosphatase family metal-dependent hydrolase
MATTESAPEPGGRLALGSYQTALCVIPPAHLCEDIDRLRALYDKAYGKWPAHINLIYPFVAVESLPRVVDLIQSTLARVRTESEQSNIQLRLNKADYFSHRHSNTIYITDKDGTGIQSLTQLRSAILGAFKHADETYNPHLTIGQSGAQDTSSPEYLLGKASLLPSIEWEVQELVLLVRERLQEQDHASSLMTVWATIELSGNTVSRAKKSPKVHRNLQTEEEWSDEEEKRTVTGGHPSAKSLPIRTDHAGAGNSSTTTYQFSTDAALWEPFRPLSQLPTKGLIPSSLKISSYNVLVDSFYPPARDRYALLLHAIFSESALADILVLQEVSDDFLSHFLRQDSVRSLYPFTTHGPPDQQGIGPLASLRNIVVLSRWSFSWEWVPFTRRHKGAVILKFDTIGKFNDSNFLPLVVAGVHLTCGLTDASVAAKKSQLQTVVNHLSSNYPENLWIVAGDFNITTSAFTINGALKNKSISSHTASAISSLETLLSEARLSDSWFVARAESSDTSGLTQGQLNFDDMYEGEQGATFDPIRNPVATETVGGGSYYRPQRYDRILVKGADLLNVTGFNMFGFPEEACNDVIQDQDPEPSCGSDHWGVRASMRIDPDAEARQLGEFDVDQATSLQTKKAPPTLSDVSALKSYLANHSIFPTDEEVEKRKDVFALVKSILQKPPGNTPGNDRSNFSIVVVATGSYALGVWSTSSDIDCLCVGSISARTFFELAGQRLRKAADLGVRILRKVKANSGTMLELDVRGVKMDLQYCPATKIAERYAWFLDTSQRDFNN